MYKYANEKQRIFTEDGLSTFLLVRDITKALIQLNGFAKVQDIINSVAGDNWLILACLDKLVELGEIKETSGSGTLGQNRTFVLAF